MAKIDILAQELLIETRAGQKATRRISAMIAGSARMIDRLAALKRAQAEAPLYQKFEFSTLQQIREIIVRAQISGKQLYFVAEGSSTEPRTIFPTYFNGQRLNVVNPDFKESYS